MGPLPVPAVAGDEARLGQVFLNVLVNAAQAIDVGHAGENGIVIETGVAGPECVFMEIRDTGSGIPPAALRHVFERLEIHEPELASPPLEHGVHARDPGVGDLDLAFGGAPEHRRNVGQEEDRPPANSVDDEELRHQFPAFVRASGRL